MDDRSSKAVDNEREEIEQYMAVHGLEPHLNTVVNDTVKDRPEDPFAFMAEALLLKSEHAHVVLGVSARETLGAQAMPALEVTVRTIQGTFSSLTAIGPYDGDARFQGRGVKKAVDAVTHLIQDKLVGRELNQPQIDAFLSSEPNVPDSVVLAVSMACCRAAAAHKNLPLHEFIAILANVPDPCLPSPNFSLVNGADFGKSPLHLQEITATLVDATSFEEAMEQGVRLQTALRARLDALGHKTVNTGRNGGLVVGMRDGAAVLQAALDAAKSIGLEKSVRFGCDLCAHKLVVAGAGGGGDDGEDDGEGAGAMYNLAKWAGGDSAAGAAVPMAAAGEAAEGEAVVAVAGALEGSTKVGDELVELYFEWLMRFKISSFDDMFDRSDSESFVKFKERLDMEQIRTKDKLAEATKKLGKGKRAVALTVDDLDDDGDPVSP